MNHEILTNELNEMTKSLINIIGLKLGGYLSAKDI